MKNKRTIAIIMASLVAVTAAVYSFPKAMLSPGELIPEHNDIASDCFACHSPFQGATPSKCIECHKTGDIGLITTKGQAIPKQAKKIPFHQHISENDCVVCHSDHKGVMAFRTATDFDHSLLDPLQQQQCQQCHDKPVDAIHQKFQDNCLTCHKQESWKPASFDHSLLDPLQRQQCQQCHDKPVDSLHQKFQDNCLTCHKQESWKPASFDHNLLDPLQRQQCQQCHDKPVDSLHQKLEDNCLTCHKQESWKPASFDHEKWFRFDRHHKPECESCHVEKGYSTYTCTSCHEHSPAKIRKEHLEEGIYQFENCVECHRSGDEHETVRSRRTEGSKKDRKRRNKYKYGEYGEHDEHDEHEEDDDDD